MRDYISDKYLVVLMRRICARCGWELSRNSEVGPGSLLNRQSRLSHGTFEELVFSFN